MCMSIKNKRTRQQNGKEGDNNGSKKVKHSVNIVYGLSTELLSKADKKNAFFKIIISKSHIPLKDHLGMIFSDFERFTINDLKHRSK